MSFQFGFEHVFDESCWKWQPATAQTQQSTDQVTTGGHVPQYREQPSWWVACFDTAASSMTEYMEPAVFINLWIDLNLT